jgi:hypothetical protein
VREGLFSGVVRAGVHGRGRAFLLLTTRRPSGSSIPVHTEFSISDCLHTQQQQSTEPFGASNHLPAANPDTKLVW